MSSRKEVDRLQPHGREKRLVDSGVSLLAHDDSLESVEIQPLLRKLIDELPGLRVFDHAADL
jgi:hypothetical protein